MGDGRLRAAAIKLSIALLVPLPHGAAMAECAATTSPQPALLAATVNGEAMSEPVLFLRDENGTLHVGASTLKQWRLRAPAETGVMMEGETYYRLDFFPGLSMTLSERDQSVTITVPDRLFERQGAGFGPAAPMPMTPAAIGGFMNYDLFAEHFRGGTSLNGAFEIGLFTPRGVGTSTFVGSAGAGPDRFVRLETAWTIDRPANATTIRLGDSISAGGQAAPPVRFGGLHYARNFAVQPGFVTMPLPSLSGSASVPSVVDVYVNSVLQGSREVGPGPFDVSNIPVQSGGGTVQLVTRDLLGRQVVSEASYYASTALLRRGLRDFSYEIGFLREDFGSRSGDYGPLMASTTQRYGVSDRITGEIQLQLSEDQQMAGAGVAAILFDLGQIGLHAAASRSERGSGARVSGSFDRRTSGLSFGLRGEYATADYSFLGMPSDYRPPRLAVQAFADMPFPGGSVGASYIHRDRRGEADESVAGVFANYRIAPRASLQLFARHSDAGKRQTIVGGHLAIALDGRKSASASVEHRAGATDAILSFQDDAPAGVGGGYRVTAGLGSARSLDAVYTANLPATSVSAQLSHARDSTGVRLSAAGGVGWLAGRAFASRSLGQSFAAVQVGPYPGVRVYADNQLVGVTDQAGAIIVPSLRPFETNRIRIDESDLPLEVQVRATEIAVRPFARSGAAVRFEARRERGVLMQVILDDGRPLPAGARVRVEGGSDTYVAASGGAVYVPDLAGAARIEARWAGGSCRFAVQVPDNDDPQPRLEGLICRSAPVYAAS